MMRRWFLSSFLLTVLVATPLYTNAQTTYLNASELLPKVSLSLSPRTGSFIVGSTFDVLILLDTDGIEVNGVEARINFDKDRLEIIKPSAALSIVGLWVEPPVYDNANGIANYVGVMPNGVNTDSGLIGTLTFRVKRAGNASISVDSRSKVYLNDGQGTEAPAELGQARFTLIPKPPEGVPVFSETHPSQSTWYNNDSPIISWDKGPSISGFSYLIDNQPSTIPENTITSTESLVQYESLDDGLWYFHLKSNGNGVWGETTHFLIRIDTTPPAAFKPEINYLLAAVGVTERVLISFFTTDNLSGIDHYEVGIIDKSQPTTVSPVFVEAESPFQLPITSNNLSVIVRAIDQAGNTRDASISIGGPPIFLKFVPILIRFIKAHIVLILLLIIIAGALGSVIHYLAAHHVIRYLQRARALMRKEEKLEEEAKEEIEEENKDTEKNLGDKDTSISERE